MAEPGARREVRGVQSPRPPISELRKRVEQGANPHSVILSVLEQDRTILSRYWEQLALGGNAPLDSAIVDLYEFEPLREGDRAFNELDSNRNLDLLSGFSYVVSNFYPKLVRASEPQDLSRKGRSITDDPVVSGILGNMNPLDADEIISEIDIHVRADEMEIEELRIVLQTEPSGIRWLRDQVDSEFAKSLDEAYGAHAAVNGVAKLYHMLTAESQPAPSEEK